MCRKKGLREYFKTKLAITLLTPFKVWRRLFVTASSHKQLVNKC